MKYTVRNTKSFRGREGLGFNASLVRDGKTVAFVYDDASGGDSSFEWVDREDHSANVTVRDHKDELHTYKGSPEEAMFAAFVFAMPKTPNQYFPEGMYMSMEMYVENLVNEVESVKEVTAKAKRMLKDLIFTVEGDKEGTFRVVSIKKAGTMERARAFVKEKYPNARILNDMTIEAAAKLLIKVE